MDFPDRLDSNARVRVKKNGTDVRERRGIDFKEGTNVALTVADNPTGEKVDVTVAVASAAPSGSAGGDLGGTYPNPTVNVDDSTIETNSNTLRVKDGGITQAKVATGYRIPYVASSAQGSPAQGDRFYDTDDDLEYIYNGSVWVCVTPVVDFIATEETTTSATYADLSTSGPAVTLLTGTTALVLTSFGGRISTGPEAIAMSVAVSGSSSIAVDEQWGCRFTTSNTTSNERVGASGLITGLTAGSNTFTAKYKTSGATATFGNRQLIVIATP